MATWTIFRDINLNFHAYFNWFTACFTVQYTIKTAIPTKLQPRPDAINTRHQNRPGNEATLNLTLFPGRFFSKRRDGRNRGLVLIVSGRGYLGVVIAIVNCIVKLKVIDFSKLIQSSLDDDVWLYIEQWSYSWINPCGEENDELLPSFLLAVPRPHSVEYADSCFLRGLSQVSTSREAQYFVGVPVSPSS